MSTPTPSPPPQTDIDAAAEHQAQAELGVLVRERERLEVTDVTRVAGTISPIGNPHVLQREPRDRIDDQR